MKPVRRWVWVVASVAATGAALLLTFLLSFATSGSALYEQHYEWLFWINVVVAGVLTLVIAIAGIRLVVRMRQGRFGSLLLVKLAAIFALVGIVPGVLIYTVSVQFVSRSIENWFDAKVEVALDAGLAMGRNTLDAQLAQLGEKARAAAERIAESGGAENSPVTLERLREQLGVTELVIVGSAGQTLGSATSEGAGLVPERPAATLLKQARAARVVTQLEGLDEDSASAGPARMRALAPIPTSNFALSEQERFLWVRQVLAPQLVGNALAVQAAYREYQERALARNGLRKMYVGTLTLALVLAVFGALVLAAALGNQLARPLLLLAQGMEQVAQGDLSAKPVLASRDELGGLTRSFAAMTAELADARGLVQRSVSQVEAARASLQTILDNLTAGVMVFNHHGRLETVNPGASRILRQPLALQLGKRLDEVPDLGEFGGAVWQRFDLHRASADPAGELEAWQDTFVLQGAPDREAQTVLVRGAIMPLGTRLVVFDDITELVSAQRAEAWSEVARRLAHEIKNPLTPIQLSAERLEHRLSAKLDAPDQAMLARSVSTIVTQVQAMKSLVNEFRDYARLPAAQLQALDLNALVSETLGLYAHATEAGRLEADLEPGLPSISGDATQLRQVVHNLVQNALDAVADLPHGRVRVRTNSARGDTGALRAVRLLVVDNGPGFPDKVLKRAFEPYVTTKSKGTGLGLAVVKKIADEHGARVRLVNLGSESAVLAGTSGSLGAQVSISFSKFASVESRSSPPVARVDVRAH